MTPKTLSKLIKSPLVLTASVLLLLTCGHRAFGQTFNWSGWPGSTDTAQGRWLISALPDSTLIEYEVTQFRIRNGAIDHFIDFNSTTDTFPEYYKTQVFSSESSFDSISFMCFASFDNRAFLHASLVGMDTTQVDSVFGSWQTIMSGTLITPDPAYFNDASFVFYLINLYNSDNDSLIRNLDSVRCFVNLTTGHIFYSASNDRPDFIRMPLNVSAGTNMYIKVQRVAILPSGSSLTDQSNIFNNQRGLREDTAWEGYQRQYPMAPPAPTVLSSVPWSGTGLNISAISPNPASSTVRFSIDISTPVASKITIADNLGRTVLTNYAKLKPGLNMVQLDISSLASGDYIITIPLADKIFQSKLVKIQ